MLRKGKPRPIHKPATDQVLVFIDACYEKDARNWRSGVGGVCFDPTYNCWQYFSLEVGHDGMLERLGENHKAQLIFEVETIAAVLGMLLWSHAFKGRLGHLFSDNEGTKFCLLRGVSDNACVNMSTQIFARHGMNSKALTWISRAIADGPSRNDCSFVSSKQAFDKSEDAKPILIDFITQSEVGDGLCDVDLPK